MSGPEERWEDRCIWKEERRLEGDERLTKEEIRDIKADESYDEGR